jgi:hypothetical protein
MSVLAIGLVSAVAGSVATIAFGFGAVYMAGREERKDVALERQRNLGSSPVRFVAAKTEGNLASIQGGLPENH